MMFIMLSFGCAYSAKCRHLFNFEQLNSILYKVENGCFHSNKVFQCPYLIELDMKKGNEY